MIGKEKITIAYPVMLKAFFTHEEINAVPVDVIEIKAFSDQKALVLPEGKYIIKIHNQKGDSLQITL